MKSVRLQFRLITFLMVAAVVPVAIACLNRVRLDDPVLFDELAVCAMAFCGGLIVRPIGAWLGRRIGPVAYHSLGWFAATLGAATVILVINAVDSPTTFFRNVRDSLGPTSLIFGIAIGTVVEFSLVALKGILLSHESERAKS